MIIHPNHLQPEVFILMSRVKGRISLPFTTFTIVGSLAGQFRFPNRAPPKSLKFFFSNLSFSCLEKLFIDDLRNCCLLESKSIIKLSLISNHPNKHPKMITTTSQGFPYILHTYLIFAYIWLKLYGKWRYIFQSAGPSLAPPSSIAAGSHQHLPKELHSKGVLLLRPMDSRKILKKIDKQTKIRITLRGTNISHLEKRKIIFKSALLRDMSVPWRVVCYDVRWQTTYDNGRRSNQ